MPPFKVHNFMVVSIFTVCNHNQNLIYDHFNTSKRNYRDFPGGPVVKTPHSQCREPRFDPRSGNQILQAATKTRRSKNNYLFIYLFILKKEKKLGFPGGTVVKNPPANAGDTGLSPGPGRSHMPWSN